MARLRVWGEEMVLGELACQALQRGGGRGSQAGPWDAPVLNCKVSWEVSEQFLWGPRGDLCGWWAWTP